MLVAGKPFPAKKSSRASAPRLVSTKTRVKPCTKKDNQSDNCAVQDASVTEVTPRRAEAIIKNGQTHC